MKKIFAILFTSIMAVSLLIAGKISNEESDYQSKSFAVQKGGLLKVDVEPGAVRIESWSKDEVFVEAEGIDERHPDRLVMSQSGNTVTVKYRDRRSYNNHLRFSIKVPSKFNADVQTSGGSITQKDVLTGDFQAETKGGSIDLDHIIGKVEVETGGGSITSECITGTLNARTGGGSITVHESGGKVNASTGGGSIKVENASAWVELSTGGGSVTVHGAKYGAKVKTGGGSVEMEDITGMVDVSTGGGSIQCELNPGSIGNSQIRTGGGEIQFSLPENAKAIVKATINEGHGWGGHHRRYSIHSDFKADTYEKNEEGDHVYAEYTLNGGGPIIILETSNSNIEIRKMSAK